MLQRLLAVADSLQHGLPFVLQLAEPLLHRQFIGSVLLLLPAQFLQPFRVLAQPFLQLLLLLQQGREAALQLLAALVALFLLFQPGSGAAGHIGEAAARHLHGGFSAAAGGFRLLQGLRAGVLLQLPLLLKHLLAAIGQVMAHTLQPLAFLLVLSGLAIQFAAAGLQSEQFRLHRQQLVFPKGLDLLLQGLQLAGGFPQGLAGAGDGGGIALLLCFDRQLAAAEIR